jgi:hypothetical protein
VRIRRLRIGQLRRRRLWLVRPLAADSQSTIQIDNLQALEFSIVNPQSAIRNPQ